MTEHHHPSRAYGRPRLRRLLVFGGVLVIALLAGPVPTARAGGPTSVMLANPATHRVAALGYDDPDYDRLADLVGLHDVQPDDAATPTPSPSAVTPDFTRQVRLTWMIHDMTVWRLDVIHQTEDGSWMIETRQSSDGSDVWQATPVWHRPADPAALFELLRDSGLMTPAEAGNEGYGLASPKATAAGEVTTAGVDPPAVTAVVGVVGVGLGLAVGLFVPRLRRDHGARNSRVILRG